MRSAIENTISNIKPFDNLEAQHIKDTLAWIRSGSSLFRIAKPNHPPKHLVSYFVLFDQDTQKILLTDHKKSGLWLPAGGHVEIDEHPYATVIRECQEELGEEAAFWQDAPLFITNTTTVGETPTHTDVSLWFVLKGQEDHSYNFEQREFYQIAWFAFNSIPYEKSDPHLSRFIAKLRSVI